MGMGLHLRQVVGTTWTEFAWSTYYICDENFLGLDWMDFFGRAKVRYIIKHEPMVALIGVSGPL